MRRGTSRRCMPFGRTQRGVSAGSSEKQHRPRGRRLLQRRRFGHEAGASASVIRRPGAEASAALNHQLRWPLVRGCRSLDRAELPARGPHRLGLERPEDSPEVFGWILPVDLPPTRPEAEIQSTRCLFLSGLKGRLNRLRARSSTPGSRSPSLRFTPREAPSSTSTAASETALEVPTLPLRIASSL